MDGIPRERMYVSNPGSRQFSPDLFRVVDPQNFDRRYGEVDDGEDGHLALKREDEFPADPLRARLLEEVQEARRHFLNEPEHFRAQSPSLPNFLPNPAPVRSTSPMALTNRPPSRPRSSQKITMPPPPQPSPKAKAKSTLVLPSINTTYKSATFDKTSSYTDSTIDRSPSPPPANDMGENKDRNRKRRPISDLLDYDPPLLKQMSFSDLDNQPFDHDPRRLTPTINTNNSTSEDAHLATLHTLRSLSSPERTRFFSSQTKEQWVVSTTFFESRLKELVKELVTARERRRDVALRFEDEVRERMKAVRGSGELIESCLGEMRGRARGVLPGRGNGMGTTG